MSDRHFSFGLRHHLGLSTHGCSETFQHRHRHLPPHHLSLRPNPMPWHLSQSLPTALLHPGPWSSPTPPSSRHISFFKRSTSLELSVQKGDVSHNPHGSPNISGSVLRCPCSRPVPTPLDLQRPPQLVLHAPARRSTADHHSHFGPYPSLPTSRRPPHAVLRALTSGPVQVTASHTEQTCTSHSALAAFFQVETLVHRSRMGARPQQLLAKSALRLTSSIKTNMKHGETKKVWVCDASPACTQHFSNPCEWCW